jgi:uncharacterized cupin superfamily protein
MSAAWIGGDACPEELRDTMREMFPTRDAWQAHALDGGMTNRSWRVRFDHSAPDVVVQLLAPPESAGQLGIRRDVQRRVEELIGPLDLAPTVLVRSDQPQAVASTFVDAVPLPAAGPDRRREIVDVAAALRVLHACEVPVGEDLAGRLSDGFGSIRWLRSGVEARSRQAIEPFAEALSVITEFERLRGAYRRCLVHSDLSAGNVLVGDRVYIIDWEYAGLGDPWYDLGGFSARNALDDDEERLLISVYNGSPDEGLLSVLRLYRFLVIVAEALWGLTAADVAFADFDHLTYSTHLSSDMRAALDAGWVYESLAILRHRTTERDTVNHAPTDRIRHARIDEAGDRWVPYTRAGVTRGEELVIHRAAHAGAGLRSMMWRTGPTRVEYVFKVDEVVTVLDGSARVEMSDGDVFELRAGDIWVFEEGQRAIWTVDDHFAKLGVLAVENGPREQVP